MLFDRLLRERNQDKKDRELQAGLQELERASLADLLETIRDDDLLIRQKQANVPLRIKAVQVLAKRGDSETVPHLIALLRDDVPAIQQEVISALGALGDDRAIEPLKRIFRSSPSSDIQAAAKTVLQNLGVPPEELSSATATRSLQSATPPDTSVQKLLMQVHHADWRIRKSAVDALGMRNDPKRVGPLLNCLTDVDWEVRLHAIRALRNFDDNRVAEALVMMMRDSVSEVSQAAKQFAESLEEQAIEPLTALLGATNVTVRENAVRLLWKIRNTRVIEPLLRALSDSDAQVRQLATDALLAINRPVVEYLAQAARHSESKARWKAVDAMSRLLDERMIPPLVDALNDTEADIRELAAQTLQTLNWKPQTPDERIAYAIALGAWDILPPFGAQAIYPLLRFADDTNVRVRRYIHEQLALACAQVKTMVFAGEIENVSDPKTTLINIDVSTLTHAFSKLQEIRINADTCDFLHIERFMTYAIDVLGEKFLKKNVTVYIIGHAERLHPNLLNTVRNLCKSVDGA